MRVVDLTDDQYLKKWEELQQKTIKFVAMDSKKAVSDLSVQCSKKDNTKGK